MEGWGEVGGVQRGSSVHVRGGGKGGEKREGGAGRASCSSERGRGREGGEREGGCREAVLFM